MPGNHGSTVPAPGQRADDDQPTDGEERAVAALEASGLRYRITRHGRVSSLAEAATARKVAPSQVVKTMVVRRGADDYLFVLVPGGRSISWPKLRALLGVSRLSMPDATVALEVTGLRRGTITPFGSTHAWPVIADARVAGRAMSIGAGAPGTAATVDGSQMVLALGATVADVTDPEQSDPSGQPDRSDRSDQPGEHERSDQPGEHERSDQPDQPEQRE